jgi:formamidopyrimidine-DNA glycosylase
VWFSGLSLSRIAASVGPKRYACAVPELPEVEIMVRNLRRWTQGRRVTGVQRIDSRIAEEVMAARGGTVSGVSRRGKYAILDLTGPRVGQLILHFRMTGKVVRYAPERRTPRLILEFAGAPAIAFEDPRCLGEMWWVPNADADRFFADRRLGPEPWPEPRDGPWWAQRLHGLRGPIKPALMRQDRVAGLGNIAASEVCWLAKIHPTTPVPALEAASYSAIARAVPAFIERTLARESGDEIHYVNLGGEGSFSVYGHAGAPCPRCGTAIERTVQGGRGTFLCPACQAVLVSCE